MKISVHDSVTGDLRDTAWELYHDAFKDINGQAVQRHLMYRGEFDDLLDDGRVEKYFAESDGGDLLGMSTLTNELEAMPLISPEYFARRWPKLYSEGRVWYVGFVATHPDGRGGTQTFHKLIEAMHKVVGARRGIVGMDYCRINVEDRRIARVVKVILHRMSGGIMRAELMDQQSFWLYDFSG